MKQFLLPLVLICFTIFCLSYVHMDNMDKLEKRAVVKEEVKDNNIAI
ncbi:hypothetical protein [Aquimarina aggregata]|nr:hypothetical protein [Aquimarina aggregata]